MKLIVMISQDFLFDLKQQLILKIDIMKHEIYIKHKRKKLCCWHTVFGAYSPRN